MHYDVVIIGGGPAGYTAAIAAAKENLKVALIEKKAVGGTCLNVGCIPTKALLHGAKVFTQVHNSESLGITCENVVFSEEKLYQQKDEIVSRLSTGIQTLLKQNGVAFYFDHASFTDEHHIQLKDSREVLEFDYAIISTGSKPIRLPLPGFDYDTVITSDELLQKPLNAEEIVIIGGGIIGCEFADYYQQIGKKVTIVEMQKRILGTLDKEIAQTINMSFKKRGIQIITNAKVTAVTKQDGKTICHYQIEEKENQVSSDVVLLSIGRTAQLDGLNESVLNLEKNRAYLAVNEHYQTSLSHIYAVGDINGQIQLAHVASSQAENAISHIVKKEKKKEMSIVPSCLYTTPEAATVGLTEEEAKAQGIPVKTGKFLLSANGRHLIETSERGFVKVLMNQQDELIGAQMCGASVSELIPVLTNAIVQKTTYTDLLKVIYPHPTISEGISEAIASIHNEAIHVFSKK